MANDSGYIINFDNSSGLPPQVVAALNNNFRYLVNRFQNPAVIFEAGVNPPSPRNNATLFYKTDNGDLYIWKHFNAIPNPDPNVQTPLVPEHWAWDKTDVGLIHVDISDPGFDQYVRQDEVIWYNTVTNNIFFWYTMPNASGPDWHSIAEIIQGVS